MAKSYLKATTYTYKDSQGKEKIADIPRGINNNNPGNLVITSIKWQGKTSTNTDGHFEQFVELRYGIRAMMRDINSDYNKGLNTVKGLINEWAPEFENNTAAYVANIAKALGIAATDKFELSQEAMLVICKTIVIVENGARAEKVLLTDKDYTEALALSGLDLKKKILCCKCCGQPLPSQA